VTDPITRIQAELSGLRGPVRARPLLELAQALTDRYMRSGPGTPAALPDLDRAIDAFREASGHLQPDDAYRGQVAQGLGWLLGLRHLAHGSPERDGDEAIGLLDSVDVARLPPAAAAMGQVVLGQLYLARAMRGLQGPGLLRGGGRADADRAVDTFRAILATPAISDEISHGVRSLLPAAEAVRDLVGGPGGPAGFDLGGMARMVAAMQTLQDNLGAMRGATPSGGFGPAPLAPLAPLGPLDHPVAALHPLDHPVAVMHPTDRTEPAPPVVPVPRRPAPVVDLDAVRAALTARLTTMAPAAADAPALAGALLRPAVPAAAVDDVDEAVGLATTLVHGGGDSGTDHLLLGVSLYVRGRLDDGGWDGGDLAAAAGSLLDALDRIPPGDPAAPTVLRGVGAVLDDREPLGGVLAAAAPRLAARAEAVVAAGSTDPVAVALRDLSRAATAIRAGRSGEVAPLRRAVAAVPESYPWRFRLLAAAGTALLAQGLRTDDPAGVREAGALLTAAVSEAPAGRYSSEVVDLVGRLGMPTAERSVFAAAERVDPLAREVATRLLGPDVEVGSAPTVADVAAAVRTVGAGGLLYPSGHLLDPATAVLRPAGAQPPARLVVVAPTPVAVAVDLPAVTAARRPVVSLVASGRQLVTLARRKPLPVADRVVFVANPRGDREAATIEAMTLRRIFYPHSVGLGHTVENVSGPATPAQVLAHLPGASLVQLGCGLRTGRVPALELADPGDGGSAWLDVEQIGAALGDADSGGLAVVPADATDWFPLADGLVDAGLVGVVGWLRPVAQPVAALMLFVLHAHLADRGLPPADAVHAAQEWMLDPRRETPPYLPAAHAVTLAGTDLTDPSLWSALCYRGR